ncbi:MAG: hypothetical protein KF864_00690 [Phycisphaeraceae bacterium]|nr:hypothetical protein [Phycisphaeraceae bacterium]
MKTLVAVAVVACAGLARGVVVEVDGRANIFGAGYMVAPDPGGGGGGVLPPLIPLSAGQGNVVQVTSVTGTVSAGFGFAFHGGDGGTSASGTTDVLSWGGISGLIHANRTLFLTGVFLGPASPSNPAPSRLNVTNSNNETEFWPLLAQTFFIGDGYNATGVPQRFNIPHGATRLYLGFVDAFDFGNPTSYPGHYSDNQGRLQATVVVVPAPAGVFAGLGLMCTMGRRRRD